MNAKVFALSRAEKILNEPYELVRLANGTASIRSGADGETFHPVIGPVAEAEALYVNQLRLRERLAKASGEFVIWDVGLGAGGNALTALRNLADIPATLRIVSFDHTLDALHFAMEHAAELKFPLGFETQIKSLISEGEVAFELGTLTVRWEVCLADFPTLLDTETKKLPAPNVIFFDAFSPATNAAMWTLPLFENLFRRLDPQRPCSLATYSRSTIPRVTMLLAGFFVGAGDAVAEKEETTVATNTLDLIAKPLSQRWLKRAHASHSAEPLHENIYSCAPLKPETWERLRKHPQFGSS